MTPPVLKSGASWIACAPPEVRETFLSELSDDALVALPYLFEFWALPHQLAPGGDWRTWVVMGGRGAGKTRAGAEWVRSMVEGPMPLDPGQAASVALVGETYEQARDVMVEGPSGILASTPPDRRPTWQATRRRLVWPNGATAQVYSAHDPEAMRGPQFDAAWLDELGCPAVDRGANEPNKFYDPKSSESALPRYALGARDDFMQMQFLRAHLTYWRDPEHNPVSGVYGAEMVDPARIFLWAWDARPYPFFPSDTETWNDGDNYALGHWLNGRTSSRSLASVVREICARAGVPDVDVSGLYGIVRGYSVPDTGTARAALQPLMLAYHFDVIEAQGQLVFRSRLGRVDATVGPDDLAVSTEISGDMERLRLPDAETAGRAQLVSVEADGDYLLRAVEAIAPDEATRSVSKTDLPLVLTEAEAGRVVARWLSDARVARDTVRFALPPSRRDVGVGDVVQIDGGAVSARYRIDRMEEAGLRAVEATRIERPAPARPNAETTGGTATSYNTALPVHAEYLDLPLLTGAESPQAPHVAVFGDPWPGAVAVYSASGEGSFRLETQLTRASVMGETVTALASAAPARWDRGAALRVRLYGGTLASVSEDAVLGGANAAAIGTGDTWEVFQFAQAELVEPETYDLTMRLRGQAGTDGAMPDVWPAGTRFVLLDGAARQTGLQLSERGLERQYRTGPASRAVDDASYVEEARAFDGIGLRPLSPAHLRVARESGGDLTFTWIRRTRIDGDSWQGVDVPLGEEREAYLVRAFAGPTLLREDAVTEAIWAYSAAMRAADGVAGAFAVEVAQVSDQFGPGLFKRIEIDG